MPHSNCPIWLIYLSVPLFFILVNEYYFQPLMPHLFESDNRRIIQLLLLAVIGLSLILSSRWREEWMRSFLSLPKLTYRLLSLFFVMGILSATLTPLPKYAFLQVSLYFLLFCLALSVTSLHRQTPKACNTGLMLSIVVAMACYCIYAFMAYGFEQLRYAAHPTLGYEMPALAWPDFVNPRFLMQFISWSLPFMVVPMLLHRKILGSWVWGCFAIASYAWCLDFANQSRIVPIQIVVVSVMILSIFKRQALPWLKLQLYTLIVGLILYILLFHILLSSGIRDLVNYDDPSRLLLWKTSVELAIHHPLLGVGPLHFPYYAYPLENIAAHPHNALLLIAAEWGLIVSLGLLGLIIWGFCRWVKTMRQATLQDPAAQTYAIALTASLLAGALDAMVDGIIVMPLSQVMLAIVLGWMLALYAQYQNQAPQPVKAAYLRLLAILAVLSLIAGAHGIWPDVLYLMQNQDFYILQCKHNCLLNPDFWTQGWIQFYGQTAS